MIIAYIQGDLRINPYLLEILSVKTDVCWNSSFREDDTTTVLGYTVAKVFNAGIFDKVVMNVFNCKENRRMVNLMCSLYPQLEALYSDICDVNQRLLDYAERLDDDDLIVRIVGEQVLLNIAWVKKTMDKMVRNGFEVYYYPGNDGTLADFVKASVLKINRTVIQKYPRYFLALDNLGIKRMEEETWGGVLPLKVTVVDPFTKELAEKMIVDDSGTFRRMVTVAIHCLFKKGSYLYDKGYLRSLVTGEVKDNEGKPIPWYTYPAIDFLKERIDKKMSVFEYGSGSSTMFFAARVDRIVSVEHDHSWYLKSANDKPDNAEILFIELEYGGEYCKKILDYHSYFNLISIDGRDRVNCAINAVEALTDDGIIIFDDSDRDFYSPAFSYLAQKGFRRLNFVGYSPCLYMKSCTSVFYRNNNIFNI